MRTPPAADFLGTFASRLKSRGALPKKMELSHLGGVTLASAFDSEPNQAISESVFSGMDPDPNVAVLKSLVEKCEREAFSEGYRRGDPGCQTERSDGFAAFPIGIAEDARAAARRNAFHEAVERYVWSNWWDNSNFAHSLLQHSNFSRPDPSLSLLSHIHAIVPLAAAYEVRPEISDRDDLVVTIFFARLKDGGMVSGGACEHPRDLARARFRALSELSRHALASHRMKIQGQDAGSFYEKRLMYFAADPAGETLVNSRIVTHGKEKIRLPGLSVDSSVPHALDDLVAVHRCLFENQPVFVGGQVERLCL